MKETHKRKKEQKESEKKKEVRSKILLLCTSVALLGAATFAWFTVSNTPRVTNLAIIAGTSGDLKIADTAQGPYGEEVDLSTGSGGNMKDVELNPSTTQDGKTFYAPVYTENAVSNVEDISAAELNTGYVYEKEFYLKAETKNPSSMKRKFDIYMVGIRSDGGGSYITNAGDRSAASAIRISFTLEDGTTMIYEPNADVHVGGEQAANHLSANYGGYETMQQLSNHRFAGSNNNNSDRLFTLTENTPTKVIMRVWLEGTDSDCSNSVAAGEITGQIQFISEEKTD